ncbi:MAG TPA: hypothetical protein VFA76_15190 [Terriglobales bacterium]|nr:hypothetical protein [Terriglobales bacterium]
MQFEVKGQQYFLSFVSERGGWYLFTPSRKGIKGIPVVDDDALSFVGGVDLPDGIEGPHKIQ